MWALSVCWVLLGTLGAGSIQLMFQKTNSLYVDVCNTSDVVIPCIITNLQKPVRPYLNIKWYLNKSLFFSYEGYQNRLERAPHFFNVEFLNILNLSKGVASLKISPKEVLPGSYMCLVEEKHDNNIYATGESSVELQYGSRFWFQQVESSLVIGAVIMGAAVFLLQVGFATVKFEMSCLKKICLVAAVLILMNFVVPGAILLVKEDYTVATQVGLGLVVLPAVILVPLLFFVFQSVFDKPPLFGIILIILKVLGYVIAVAGMVASLSECPRKQASVVIAGLGIMDLVAVLVLTYLAAIGTRFKDHQPPKIAVGELRKAKK